MPKFKDLTGQRFGLLVAESRAPSVKGQTYWLCRCDCGRLSTVRAGNLASGMITGCGCRRSGADRAPDMTGRRFGRLVALTRDGTTPLGLALWAFQCDCGTRVTLPATRVRAGAVASCGCLKLELFRENATTHGRSKTNLYGRWVSMKARCHNPKDARYADYGGRGISVCQEWRDSFEQFALDVGEPPEPHLQLDRIDNDGNYEPGNVRWATRSQQQLNKRPYPAMTMRAIRHLEDLGWTLIPPVHAGSE